MLSKSPSVRTDWRWHPLSWGAKACTPCLSFCPSTVPLTALPGFLFLFQLGMRKAELHSLQPVHEDKLVSCGMLVALGLALL